MSFLIVAIFVFFLGNTLKAQEVAVPWDSAGRVYVLTEEMESKILLFPDIQGLLEARIYRANDSTYSLEVISRFGEEVRRERKPLTLKEVTELKARFEERVATSAPSLKLDQSGRSSLLWGSALWSLFYYGTAITVAIGPEEENISTALPFIIAPVLGYFIPALLTQNSTVTEGSATLALGGMFQGAIHGWALTGLIQGEDADERVGAGVSVLTGIAETVVGFTVARNTGMKEGHASMINTTEFYGSVLGLYSGLLVGSSPTDVEMNLRTAGAVALLGAAGGVFVGNAMGNTNTFTGGDAGVYALGGFLGATMPMAILAAIEPESIDPRVLFGGAIVTTVGGLYVGQALVKGKDYSSSLVPVLATLGGGLFGMGVGLLIDTGNAPTIAGWLGATAGFAIGLATTKSGKEGSFRDKSGLYFNLNPAGFAALVLPSTSKYSMPLGNVSYHW